MLREIWAALTGKRHWYNVTLEYVQPWGEVLVCKDIVLGFALQEDVLRYRRIRKQEGAALVASVPNRRRCNGRIIVRVNSYLGKFRDVHEEPPKTLVDPELLRVWLLNRDLFNNNSMLP